MNAGASALPQLLYQPMRLRRGHPRSPSLMTVTAVKRGQPRGQLILRLCKEIRSCSPKKIIFSVTNRQLQCPLSQSPDTPLFPIFHCQSALGRRTQVTGPCPHTTQTRSETPRQSQLSLIFKNQNSHRLPLSVQLSENSRSALTRPSFHGNSGTEKGPRTSMTR